jgi:hypothetical protein
MSPNKTLDEIKKLRDEIRDRLHKAGEETKKWWQDVEPQLAKLEDNIMRGSDKAADVSRTVAEEFASAFKRIRDRVSAPEDAESDEATSEAGADESDVAEAEVVDAELEGDTDADADADADAGEEPA